MSILKEIYEYKIDFVSNQKEITPQSKIESKLNINNINCLLYTSDAADE